jgi:mannose-1-phosphate guanylyltransferase
MVKIRQNFLKLHYQAFNPTSFLMTNANYYVVIMAGGTGTRLWPYSRQEHPKQFHDFLDSGQSLLQATAERFRSICPDSNILVVTSLAYKERILAQLPFLSESQVLTEPFKRNTAPCIAYASYKIRQQDPDALIVVTPVDQIILEEARFHHILQQALTQAALHPVLLTLGVKPSRPDTGFGYIQFVEGDDEICKVKTFTEKPPQELAEKFLESGDFVWNAGIFVWRVSAIIQALETHLVEIAENFVEALPHFGTAQEAEAIETAYTKCKSISIDYGVMEKADNVYVITGDFGWRDLGTWKSVYEVLPKDKHGNVSSGTIQLYETKNTLVKAPKDRLVVIQGLDDYIVTEFDNVLLICKKDQEQRVREFVEDARKRGEGFV